MTAQEIMDRVWETMKARGFTPALEGRMCRYRSAVGPCAAGVFIPDDKYDESLEGSGVGEDHVWAVLAPIVGEENLSLIERLQEAHDTGFDVEGMDVALRKVAYEFDLMIEGKIPDYGEAYPNGKDVE